jgi:hypothetical protein
MKIVSLLCQTSYIYAQKVKNGVKVFQRELMIYIVTTEKCCEHSEGNGGNCITKRIIRFHPQTKRKCWKTKNMDNQKKCK